MLIVEKSNVIIEKRTHEVYEKIIIDENKVAQVLNMHFFIMSIICSQSVHHFRKTTFQLEIKNIHIQFKRYVSLIEQIIHVLLLYI